MSLEALNEKLLKACEAGKDEEVQQLLEAGADVNAKNRGKETPLHLAVFNKDTNMAELLLRHDADVKAKDWSGFTPLRSAVSWKDTNMAELLLQHKADVNAKDLVYDTPLHMAVLMEDTTMAELLLKNHAATDVINSRHKTPIHCAAEAQNVDLVVMMVKVYAGLAYDAVVPEPMHNIIETCVAAICATRNPAAVSAQLRKLPKHTPGLITKAASREEKKDVSICEDDCDIEGTLPDQLTLREIESAQEIKQEPAETAVSLPSELPQHVPDVSGLDLNLDWTEVLGEGAA